MVKVASLQGITYNLNNPKVEINKVLAPPYDVIDEKQRDDLYNKSEFNFVRLILGREADRYANAERLFREWQESGILVKSPKPCIYYYIQEYTTEKGEKVNRKGFIARTYLEDYETGNIFPHEVTMSGPKQDRLELMKACKANFSPIFMLYSDKEKQIDKILENETGRLFFEVKDNDGIVNKIYIIEDEKVLEKVSELMKDKKAVIADGHHRYETALKYSKLRQEGTANPRDEKHNFNWVLSYYTNLDDEKNLKVYPTHRIVTKKNVNTDRLVQDLETFFTVKEFDVSQETLNKSREEFIAEIETKSKDNIVFGLYLKEKNKYFLIELKKDKVNDLNALLDDKSVPKPLRKLDLTILHKVIITDFLNISEQEQEAQKGIEYMKSKDESEFFKKIDDNSAEIAFLVASPKLQTIKEITETGCKMPQKTTFFYPKLLSGPVINYLG